jgi:hypothetical protein
MFELPSKMKLRSWLPRASDRADARGLSVPRVLWVLPSPILLTVVRNPGSAGCMRPADVLCAARVHLL